MGLSSFQGLVLVLRMFGWLGFSAYFRLSSLFVGASWYGRKLLSRSLGTISFCMKSDLGYWLKLNLSCQIDDAGGTI